MKQVKEKENYESDFKEHSDENAQMTDTLDKYPIRQYELSSETVDQKGHENTADKEGNS